MKDDYFEGEYILHAESAPPDGEDREELPERKTINGINYIKDPITEIYFPFAASDDKVIKEENQTFGKFGSIRKAFLAESFPEMYRFMHATYTLASHLEKIDRIAEKHLNTVIESMKKERGITDKMKDECPVDHMIAMNNIRDEAEKIVLADVIYNERFIQVGLEDLYC